MKTDDYGFSAAERERLIEEAFDGLAMVGFLKWKREEIEQQGVAPDEADRPEYIEAFRRIAWPEFREMAAQASDDRLLDLRQDWMERAERLALLDARGGLTIRHVHDELQRYGKVAKDPVEEARSRLKAAAQGQEGRGR